MWRGEVRCGRAQHFSDTSDTSDHREGQQGQLGGDFDFDFGFEFEFSFEFGFGYSPCVARCGRGVIQVAATVKGDN